jgi:menaquinol-cytochrome c reductase iron-sulfur subunit
MTEKTDDAQKRRTFLVAATAGGCAIAIVVGAPALGFVGAPAAAAGGGGLRFVIAKLSELEVGVPKKFAIVGDEVDAWTRAPKRKLGTVWLHRTGEREVKAFTATCPHLGCAVDIVADEAGKPTGYNCPCHDSNFDLAGNRGEGPAPRGLDPLPVELEGEAIAVVFKRFRIGSESREEIG